jgi:AraC-like DNA-binding protein
MYADVLRLAFDLVTGGTRSLGSRRTHISVPETRSSPVAGSRGLHAAVNSLESVGSARINTYRHLPDVLRELGADLQDVLEVAGMRADVFDDAENRIAYPDLARLLLACEQLSRCDYIAFLAGQRTRLADFGLPGQVALCSETAGEALQKLADNFTLHNSAAILSLITSGTYARFAYAIVEQGMVDTRHFQLGAIAIAFNILRDLCGTGFLPTVVTFASRTPSNLRPFHKFFRAPLRFDSDESAVVFEQHWLDRPLPPVDPLFRQQIEAGAWAQRDAILADFPVIVRRLLRKQLLIGNCSMDHVADRLGMHRRTLDRHLQRHGLLYGELLESVQSDVACQLLLDTGMQVQQVAETLRYSSAANFATAFRRWTGVTPSQYRRRAG